MTFFFFVLLILCREVNTFRTSKINQLSWREVCTFHIYFTVSQPRSHMEKSYVKKKVEELGGRGRATAQMAVHEPTASILRLSKASMFLGTWHFTDMTQWSNNHKNEKYRSLKRILLFRIKAVLITRLAILRSRWTTRQSLLHQNSILITTKNLHFTYKDITLCIIIYHS